MHKSFTSQGLGLEKAINWLIGLARLIAVFQQTNKHFISQKCDPPSVTKLVTNSSGIDAQCSQLMKCTVVLVKNLRDSKSSPKSLSETYHFIATK